MSEYKAGDRVIRTVPGKLWPVGTVATLKSRNPCDPEMWEVDPDDAEQGLWRENRFEPIDSPVEPLQELREGDRVKHDTLGDEIEIIRLTPLLRERGVCEVTPLGPENCSTVFTVALNLLTKVEPEEELKEDDTLYTVDVSGGGRFTYVLIDVGRFAKAMAEAGDTRAFSTQKQSAIPVEEEGEQSECDFGGDKHDEAFACDVCGRLVCGYCATNNDGEWLCPNELGETEKAVDEPPKEENKLTGEKLWHPTERADATEAHGVYVSADSGEMPQQPEKTLREKLASGITAGFASSPRLSGLYGIPQGEEAEWLAEHEEKVFAEHFDSKRSAMLDVLKKWGLGKSDGVRLALVQRFELILFGDTQ